jgi:hypothetical protein
MTIASGFGTRGMKYVAWWAKATEDVNIAPKAKAIPSFFMVKPPIARKNVAEPNRMSGPLKQTTSSLLFLIEKGQYADS